MGTKQMTTQKGLIAWFASNPVAANLLMAIIIIYGLFSAFSIRQQTMPDFELNNIQITVPYRGAAPQEVEEGVIIKIEEAVQNVQGINKISSFANEGSGRVVLEVNSDFDMNQVLSEVKNQVDTIFTFPAQTEKPVISKQLIQQGVLYVNINGDMDQRTRKEISQQVRDDLVRLPEVNRARILGDRSYEISVEVTEDTLRKYGLTMSDVSNAINRSSLDIPGGVIKTDGGDILLRTKGQAYTGNDFGNIVLRTFADGTRLTISDIANIRDDFVETSGFSRFNGKTTATVEVVAIGDQNEIKTSEQVRAYIEKKQATLPDGLKLDVWGDRSFYLKGRLDMMISNMLQGALLVFLILTLFLRLKVAFWVILGIPICFLGAVSLMPVGPFPVTINMISLFGFILVLGIVVDDAIIIGESIYSKIRKDGKSLDNVIKGANKVAIAATFGVLTTIAAFAPMLFVGGIAGPFFEALSMVVALALVFSLIESKLILPAHLAHAKIEHIPDEELYEPYSHMPFYKRPVRAMQRFQRGFQNQLQRFIHGPYKRTLKRAIDIRGVTVSLFLAALLIVFGLMQNTVRFVIFPDVPGEFIIANFSMQSGTSPRVRNQALDQVEQAALDLNKDLQNQNAVGEAPINYIMLFTNGDTAGTIMLELTKSDARTVLPDDITTQWRERVGEIPGARELRFSSGMNIGGGSPISFRLTGNNYDALEKAADELKKKLTEYNGVFDIRNSFSSGAEEIQLSIRPEAEALGLTQSDLGRQVRQAFYGEEAQRIQRGKDEIRVMVRYPLTERRSIADLEQMYIRTPSGTEVPFFSVADVEVGTSYSTIVRENRKRAITVTADADLALIEPAKVIQEIRADFMPELVAKYSGVDFELEGASLEEQKLLKNILVASVIALFLIYALIAIPLHSYSQPIIIMSVIPFGLIGAIVGHIVFGKAVSMMSLFGLIALAGVVVNDSLIMMDFINKARQEGLNRFDAVIQSGTARFRAIILTSLTTAGGLLPIMLETSTQAQFVIPMAISMSFGIIFATVITLFLIPCLYLLLLDFKEWFGMGEEAEVVPSP